MSLIITVNISTCLLIYQKFSSNYIINRSEIAVVTCTEIPQCDVNKNSSCLSYISTHQSTVITTCRHFECTFSVVKSRRNLYDSHLLSN